MPIWMSCGRLPGTGSASASMRLPPDACCCFCRIAAKSFHGMSSWRLYGKHGGGRFAKYVLSKYLFAAKIAGKSWTIWGYHYHRPAKGFSVAPNTLVIPLSDEECENMNRVTLTHYQNNKVVGFISEDKEKPDTHLNLPLIENSSNHDSDLMANKTEEGEKVSERLHVTFKIPIWLIALIVVMIVINIIVLVALNR